MFESQLERWIVSQAGHDLPLAVVLPSGRRIDMAQPAKVEIRLKELSAVRYLLDPTLNNMGTAYVEGEIDLEGSVEDVIDVGVRLSRLTDGEDFREPEKGLLSRLLSQATAIAER